MILVLIACVVHYTENVQIVYSSICDSTKGYPGEGPNADQEVESPQPSNSTVNNHIKYSAIFDSTKGYPGEGPDCSGTRGKKRGSSTLRGDKKWKTALF